MTTTLYTPTRDELADLLAGEPRYRLDQVWQGLYTQLAAPADITNVPKALRERLSAALPTALTQVVRRVSDNGDTVKYLWELHDGSRVETVLMLYPDRVTVCVSSQAGCAMACGFCATGQAGFTRHLTVGEIVEQVVVSARDAKAMESAGAAGLVLEVVPSTLATKVSEILTIPIPSDHSVAAVISLASVRAYDEASLRLLDDIRGALIARVNGVLAFRDILRLSDDLEHQNRELDAQKRELGAQASEL
ncbi:MAG: hypothetical protein WCI22_13475, partial [Actinomycetota bacterium]